ncbi:MAG: NADH-quinone oxidoreductase subunit J [Elusimicrobia bacterium]|nr:MAG: NADH-quinone oxidoreductase subunit J [Elusimicrobiota bacterium]
MEQIAFYSLAAVTLFSALGVVMLRNVLHSALLLGLCLAGVAGLFASLGADFLFAAQILIYVSGIAVLVLFVVLLAGRQSELHLRQTNRNWVPALAVAGTALWALGRVGEGFRSVVADSTLRPTTRLLGRLLMDDYAVPFELVSLILIAALVGAIVFTRPDAKGES